jgi:hypothetical protein
MRQFREERQGIGTDEELIQQEVERPSQQRFESRGALPAVSDETGFDQSRTAGELAFGTDEDAYRSAASGKSWKGSKTRTIAGKYGTYTIIFGAVHYKGEGQDENRPKIDIEMTPHSNVTTPNPIGFLQTTRFMEAGAKDWSKNEPSEQLSGARVAKTDGKTGWRVDRMDTEKTPFYGTTRDPTNGQLVTGQDSGNHLGGAGRGNPVLRDRPDATPGTRAEFITTATDTKTGEQYDAFSWGYRVDGDGGVQMDEPKLIDSYDERLIGRDRAINQWNGATDGEKSKTFDPVKISNLMFSAKNSKNMTMLRELLGEPENRTPEHMEKVKANYQFEYGHALKGDLIKALGNADEARFKDWLT